MILGIQWAFWVYLLKCGMIRGKNKKISFPQLLLFVKKTTIHTLCDQHFRFRWGGFYCQSQQSVKMWILFNTVLDVCVFFFVKLWWCGKYDRFKSKTNATEMKNEKKWQQRFFVNIKVLHILKLSNLVLHFCLLQISDQSFHHCKFDLLSLGYITVCMSEIEINYFRR